MSQALRGRKSKPLDKVIRLEKRESMRKRHVARRRLPTLANWNNSVGRGKKGGKDKKKEEEMRSEKLHLLSRFYGDWTVGFRQSKRQSLSTRRELCVGIRIWGFYPILVIFLMTLSVLGREWPYYLVPKLWDQTLKFSDCFRAIWD